MIKGTVKQAAKAEFRLPNLAGVKTVGARPDRIRTHCTVVARITKVKPIVTQDNDSAIVPEFVIEAIEDQRDTEVFEDGEATGRNAIPHKVGDAVSCFFLMGKKYGYGERDWASLLEACGLATEEERNAAQEEILGEDNPLGEGGMLVRIKNVQKDSGYLNPYFSAYNAEAKSA